MRGGWFLAAVLALPAAAPGQAALLPSGTILPISLNRSLNAAKLDPGAPFLAEVMQNIPGTPVRRRAKVLGHVVEASVRKNGPARLAISFDAVRVHGRLIPFKAHLRALASLVEVEEAQIPEEEASRGLTPETWTTQQIGGDMVYRGGGPVAQGLTPVGTPAPYGILGLPQAGSGQPCRGVIDGDRQTQAWWLFSTDACGVYGFDDIRIEHAGRTAPQGEIVLTSPTGRLDLYGGSGLLLRVQR